MSEKKERLQKNAKPSTERLQVNHYEKVNDNDAECIKRYVKVRNKIL